MKWYKKMYLGDNARKKRFKIMAGVSAGRWQYDVYLIRLSDNPDNILEMFSTNMLLQPHYKGSAGKMLVLGAACGYDEGLEVMSEILSDTYRERGDFDVAGYLGLGGGK
jgi:hypothetical protein